MAGIFISYRRSDSAGYAGHLYECLQARFGKKFVFFDVSDIPPGEDFRKMITDRVIACDVVLVLIGKTWVSATNEDGTRRLDDPKDNVRLEAAAALKANVAVIPVLLQGATMPQQDQLPQDLRDLVRLHAVELRDAHWDADFSRLVKAPSMPAGLAESRRRRRRLAIVLVCLVVLAACITWFLRVDVPQVSGLPVEAAQAVLKHKKLGYRISESGRLANRLASLVIQQQPPAGTGLWKRNYVDLVIDRGTASASAILVPAAAVDANFQHSILGTWRSIRFIDGLFLDQEATYTPDGRVSWKGHADLQGFTSPYALRGEWQIKDGHLFFTVMWSSVPAYIPPGYQSSVKIIDIKEDEFALIDEGDGQVYVDLRLKP